MPPLCIFLLHTRIYFKIIYSVLIMCVRSMCTCDENSGDVLTLTILSIFQFVANYFLLKITLLYDRLNVYTNRQVTVMLR